MADKKFDKSVEQWFDRWLRPPPKGPLSPILPFVKLALAFGMLKAFGMGLSDLNDPSFWLTAIVLLRIERVRSHRQIDRELRTLQDMLVAKGVMEAPGPDPPDLTVQEELIAYKENTLRTLRRIWQNFRLILAYIKNPGAVVESGRITPGEQAGDFWKLIRDVRDVAPFLFAGAALFCGFLMMRRILFG